MRTLLLCLLIAAASANPTPTTTGTTGISLEGRVTELEIELASLQAAFINFTGPGTTTPPLSVTSDPPAWSIGHLGDFHSGDITCTDLDGYTTTTFPEHIFGNLILDDGEWTEECTVARLNSMGSRLKSVTGDVKINFKFAFIDRTNANFLSNLNFIGGDLVWSNADITSYEGLDSLAYVGGGIHFDQIGDVASEGTGPNYYRIFPGVSAGNSGLFPNLLVVRDGIHFDQLKDDLGPVLVRGFDKLVYAKWIHADYPGLVGFDGFAALESVQHFRINSDMLRKLSFPSLTFVGEFGWQISAAGIIAPSESHASFPPMPDHLEFNVPKLHAVAGDFSIQGIDSLVNINGLSTVTVVGGSVTLENNYQLNDITGLANLGVIQGSQTRICFNNATLTVPSVFNSTTTTNGFQSICDGSMCCNGWGCGGADCY